jgi:hypothetical protein
MNTIVKILILTLLISVSGCATKKRTIKMASLGDVPVKVGIDSDIALINFDRTDLIYLYEKDLKDWYDPGIKSLVDDLKSIKSDTIFVKDRNISSSPLSDYELKFHDLILEGKAEIILKGQNSKLEKVKYERHTSKLGQVDANFYTKEGLEFYHILLAFGE